MKVFDMILKEEKTVIDNIVIGTKHKFTYSDGMVVERYFNDYEVIDNSKYEVREYYSIASSGELLYDVIRVKPSYKAAYEKFQALLELEDDTELCYPSIPEKTRDEFIKKMLKKGKQIITIIHLPNTKPNDNLTGEQRIMLNKIEHIDWRKANIEDVTKVYEIIKNY